jgi:hypothetical protein
VISWLGTGKQLTFFYSALTRPRIVAAVFAKGLIGEGIGHGSGSLPIFYTPFRFRSTPLHLVS